MEYPIKVLTQKRNLLSEINATEKNADSKLKRDKKIIALDKAITTLKQ